VLDGKFGKDYGNVGVFGIFGNGNEFGADGGAGSTPGGEEFDYHYFVGVGGEPGSDIVVGCVRLDAVLKIR
jgi:hypothetical protein